MVEDKHVIETLGKVRVVIENGEITEVGESEMKYCPMFHAMHGVDELNEEFIRKNIKSISSISDQSDRHQKE